MKVKAKAGWQASRVWTPAAGQLFLRCADAWTELADNDGEVTVTIRRAP